MGEMSRKREHANRLLKKLEEESAAKTMGTLKSGGLGRG